MSGTVDLALVPAFIEVVRAGSFTQAAKVLGLPKSTVSRHVSRLEEGLGVLLLARTTRSLRLTEVGEVFYHRVATALDSVEEAAQAIAEQRTVPRGLLRISIPPDYEHLPAVVASFLERYPEVEVEVDPSGNFVDMVADGYDLAVRAGELPDSSLVARKLAMVEFHLYASPAYLEAHGEPRTVGELAEHNCVLFRPQHGVSRWVLTGPHGVERVDVRGTLRVEDLLFARGAVIAGVGIGLLPANPSTPTRGLVRVLPEYARPAGAVHIVYPASRHVPAKVRAFRDHILEFSPWGT